MSPIGNLLRAAYPSWMRRISISLLLLFCLLSNPLQGKDVYTIGILIEERRSDIEYLLTQLKNEVTAVVGEDAEVAFPEQWILAHGNNKEKAQANFEALMEGPVDLILAFGPINSVVVSQKKSYDKPTILFGVVPGDFIEVDRKRSTSGIHNFAYLISNNSIREDISSLKGIYDFKNVGIAVSRALTENLKVEEYLADLFTDSSESYTLIPFSACADIIVKLDEIDALYIGSGYLFTRDEMNLLIGELNSKKIPSFTGTSIEDVEAGLLATHQTDANRDQLFRRIALSVEAIINGVDAAELPLYLDNSEELTINFNTAELLNIPIRYSQIATTHFVGDSENLGAEKRYDLKSLMEEVLLSNLTVKSSQKGVELVEQDLRLAKSNYFPDLSAGATATHIDPALAEVSNGQNPEYSTAGNLNLTQVLFSPAANANIRIQKELLQAEKENLNTEKLDAVFQASSLYFNALLLKANLKINKSNMELTEENLKLAQQKFESGQSGKPDVLRFQSQLAQNTQQFVESYNQLQQAFFSLNLILNQPINRQIDVLDAEIGEGVYAEYNYEGIKEILDNPLQLEPFIKFLTQEALNNSPELKSLSFNLRANDHNLWLNGQGRYLPTLALQGQVNSTWSRSGAGKEFPMGFPSIPNNYYTLGVNLSIPIFQQNQRNINRQSAIVQREQILINQDNLELSLEQNVSSAVLQVINQIANLELSKVFEQTAKESLELTQEAYKTGGVTWVQLIDAQNNYFQAQLASETAVYNFLNSAISLERNMGSFFILNSEAENEAFRQRFFNYLQTGN